MRNFYTALTSNGSLNWDLSTDLCDQSGVVCDSSNPKRVVQLYFPFSFSFVFFKKKKTKSNRNLSNRGLQGPIPTQLISLSNLQKLYEAFSSFMSSILCHKNKKIDIYHQIIGIVQFLIIHLFH